LGPIKKANIGGWKSMSNIVRITQDPGSLVLAALSRKDQRSLLTSGHPRSYRKGELIFSRGDEGDWILLIEEGMVEISVISLNGRKSILNHMEKGEILGEIALFDRDGRSADATALSAVKGTVINRHSVFDVLKGNDEAYFSIIETLCSRARNASEMFETQSLTAASARLARCLIRVSEKWGFVNTDGSIYIKQQFSQSDLGELAGIARENVNRHLQTWTQEKLIEFDQGDITLLKPDKLREIAELF